MVAKALGSYCIVRTMYVPCPALSTQDSLIFTQKPFYQEQAHKVPGTCTKMLTAKGSKGEQSLHTTCWLALGLTFSRKEGARERHVWLHSLQKAQAQAGQGTGPK